MTIAVADSDRTAIFRWGWEPGHYRRELGEQMPARMIGSDCAAGMAAFGTRLRPDTRIRHLATEAAATAAADDPSLCSRVDAAIRKVR